MLYYNIVRLIPLFLIIIAALISEESAKFFMSFFGLLVALELFRRGLYEIYKYIKSKKNKNLDETIKEMDNKIHDKVMGRKE